MMMSSILAKRLAALFHSLLKGMLLILAIPCQKGCWIFLLSLSVGFSGLIFTILVQRIISLSKGELPWPKVKDDTCNAEKMCFSVGRLDFPIDIPIDFPIDFYMGKTFVFLIDILELCIDFSIEKNLHRII